ncbi:O-antigen ligase family protein, partial [Candidatus Aerophobetes bacterium]|nr:O-antigen ligase family protein [Candidatus Aerophobetes bacterium]
GFFLFLIKYDLLLSIINTYGTVDERLYTWENIILPLFKKHPFFGSGLATYREVSCVFTSEFVLRHHAHNLYFNYLVEIGIFGLSGLLLVVGWFLKSCLKELKKGYEEKLFLEGCFLAIVGALIHGSVETFIDFFQLGLLFFAIIGLGTGVMEKNHDFNTINTPIHMRSTPNTLTRLIFSPRKSQEKRRTRM